MRQTLIKNELKKQHHYILNTYLVQSKTKNNGKEQDARIQGSGGVSGSISVSVCGRFSIGVSVSTNRRTKHPPGSRISLWYE